MCGREKLKQVYLLLYVLLKILQIFSLRFLNEVFFLIAFPNLNVTYIR